MSDNNEKLLPVIRLLLAAFLGLLLVLALQLFFLVSNGNAAVEHSIPKDCHDYRFLSEVESSAFVKELYGRE